MLSFGKSKKKIISPQSISKLNLYNKLMQKKRSIGIDSIWTHFYILDIFFFYWQ